jgi:hypothetical protein
MTFLRKQHEGRKSGRGDGDFRTIFRISRTEVILGKFPLNCISRRISIAIAVLGKLQ